MTPRIFKISSSPGKSSSSSSDKDDEPPALPPAFKTQLAPMLSYDSIDHLREPSPGFSPLSFRHQVPNLLVSSPYTDRDHLLDLDGMDPQTRLLALALTSLSPARADYATCAYDLALNWESVFSVLGSLACEARIRWTRQSFYVVEFRSRLKDGADRERLFALDKHSHAEAVRSGGLLKYWYGNPDAELANLATCVWHSREDAIRGGQGPWHAQAREAVSRMYDMISVEGKILTVDDEARGWRFTAVADTQSLRGERGKRKESGS